MNHMVKPYVDALLTEISLNSEELRNKKIDSIYIGGGTPSFLSSNYIHTILKSFNFDKDTEITIEVNPDTADYKKFIEYKQMGINRISFGVQSFDDEILKLMGRSHTSQESIKKILECQSAGFDNISADLIFGYPKQSLSQYKETLEIIKKIEVQHISAYSLSVEDGTLLSNMIKKGLLPTPNDKDDRLMYHYTIESLAKTGFSQYEISNFSQVRYESRHNLGYWERDNYLGFGISAHSLMDNVRFENTDNIYEYVVSLKQLVKPRINIQELTKEEIITEHIILALRLTKGLNIYDFEKEFGENFEEKYEKALETLVDRYLLEKRGDNYSLTRQGLDLANQVFVEFV